MKLTLTIRARLAPPAALAAAGAITGCAAIRPPEPITVAAAPDAIISPGILGAGDALGADLYDWLLVCRATERETTEELTAAPDGAPAVAIALAMCWW